MKQPNTRPRHAGATVVEFALIAPAVMLTGLGLVQVGLVFHGKSALNFSLQEAARAGAENNADPDSISKGLIRGLIPYKMPQAIGKPDAEDFATSLVDAGKEFGRGSAEGWIRIQQISPSPQSFSDWQEDGVDDKGNPIKQIPNANLPVLRCTRKPNTDIAGYRTSTACPGAGERVGADSQQTLADANLLKLQLTYGVRLGIPFINLIVGKALAMAAGCAAPTAQKVGLMNLGTPATGVGNASACAAYNAVDIDGNPDPRIPVSLAVTVRMQSPARSYGNKGWFQVASRGRDANTNGAQLGNGKVDDASKFAPIPVTQLNPNGVPIGSDKYNTTGNGSTHIGDPDSIDRLGDPGSPITCTGH